MTQLPCACTDRLHPFSSVYSMAHRRAQTGVDFCNSHTFEQKVQRCCVNCLVQHFTHTFILHLIHTNTQLPIGAHSKDNMISNKHVQYGVWVTLCYKNKIK